jgi:poly(hydroxyalkanoate) granule-associated protein
MEFGDTDQSLRTQEGEMAKKVEIVVEEPAEGTERSPLYEATRKMVLASMGAMALAQEEVEQFVGKLVERGEIAEKEGKKLVREAMDRRKKETKKAEGELDKRMEEILARMNVPSKSDIDALSAKITALTKKVDELKKES